MKKLSARQIQAQKPNLYLSTDVTCQNHCITFKDSTITTKPSTYQWFFVGGNIQPVAGATLNKDTLTLVITSTLTPFPPAIKVCYPTVSVLNNNGYFPVTETITNGSGTFTLIDSVRIVPATDANAGNDTTVFLGGTIYLSSNHTSSYVPISSFAWSGPNNFASTASNPVITNASVLNSGQYNLLVTDQAGCQSGSSVNVSVTTTGIKQLLLSTEVTIYPNPSTGSFVIEPQNTWYNVHCTVYDVNGKVVLHQIINGKTILDAGNLNEGVYNISLLSNGVVLNKRLIIVK